MSSDRRCQAHNAVVLSIGNRPDQSLKAAPGFVIPKEQMDNFAKVSNMRGQEGIYLAYLTHPEAIARILPPPLKPFSIPVVTLSVCHIKDNVFQGMFHSLTPPK